ncbi:transcriptional regulator [Brevibacillus laterosporus]|nr:transcriptional regulator [Brevibacillus laterosporus]TPG87870.1 transcriptional regulator [Brevibacillus laterosporus]
MAVKFLESSKKDTIESLENLFEIAGTFGNNDVRLTLYGVIIKYSRTHGLPLYTAKGLFQKYLIDRQNFKRMDKSFRDGEEIIHYVDFLPHEDKVTYYYRMALQAFAIKNHEACIELGKTGHAEDYTINELKERVALAICNSYLLLGDYTTLEEHLTLYEKLNYTFIIERIQYYRALILSKTGNYDEALPLLWGCLEEVTDYQRLHRANMLLEALFQINDFDAIGRIIESEEKRFLLLENEPFQCLELGKYYRFKGTYLVKKESFELGMEAYLSGIYHYGKINAYKEIVECSRDIYFYHCLMKKT